MRAFVVVVGLIASCAPTTSAQSLFDGKSLAGWRGDPELWSVQAGAIVGVTDGTLAHNSFLIHDGDFADFVLTLSFKLHVHNSGVQFRSRVVDESAFIVSGDQADITDDLHMGTLSDERGRGVLVNTDADALVPHLNVGDWNDYRIAAVGPHIELAINGFTTVTYVEQDVIAATSGVIALQLHTGEAMEVDFRNLHIAPP